MSGTSRHKRTWVVHEQAPTHDDVRVQGVVPGPACILAHAQALALCCGALLPLAPLAPPSEPSSSSCARSPLGLRHLRSPALLRAVVEGYVLGTGPTALGGAPLCRVVAVQATAGYRGLSMYQAGTEGRVVLCMVVSPTGSLTRPLFRVPAPVLHCVTRPIPGSHHLQQQQQQQAREGEGMDAIVGQNNRNQNNNQNALPPADGSSTGTLGSASDSPGDSSDTFHFGISRPVPDTSAFLLSEPRTAQGAIVGRLGQYTVLCMTTTAEDISLTTQLLSSEGNNHSRKEEWNFRVHKGTRLMVECNYQWVVVAESSLLDPTPILHIWKVKNCLPQEPDVYFRVRDKVCSDYNVAFHFTSMCSYTQNPMIQSGCELSFITFSGPTLGNTMSLALSVMDVSKTYRQKSEVIVQQYPSLVIPETITSYIPTVCCTSAGIPHVPMRKNSFQDGLGAAYFLSLVSNRATQLAGCGLAWLVSDTELLLRKDDTCHVYSVNDQQNPSTTFLVEAHSARTVGYYRGLSLTTVNEQGSQTTVITIRDTCNNNETLLTVTLSHPCDVFLDCVFWPFIAKEHIFLQ